MTRLLVAVLICAAIGAAIAPGAPAGAADSASVLVRTTPPVRKSMTTVVTGYGTVMADTGAMVNVSVPRAGQVASLDITPGQRVRRGTSLLTFATDPSAMASYRQAKTAVHTARDDLQRMQHLAAQQLATRSQLAAARKALADAQATLAAQRALGNGVHRTVIKAPFDGIVQAVNVKPGDRLAAGSVVAQLFRSGALKVEVGIQPEDAGRIEPDMTVRLTSVFGGGDITGHVTAVQGLIDTRTRLVNVAVHFDCGKQCGGGLLPGTAVKGVIDVARHTVWTVPRSAVLSDARGAYVFQVADGHARRVAVKVVAQTTAEDGIVGDLDPHRKVVTLGNYELANGMAVREGK
jgi:RND family efflux transporter MFP subunit